MCWIYGTQSCFREIKHLILFLIHWSIMDNKLSSLIKTSLSDGHLSMTLLCTTGVLQKASFSILFSFHSRVLLIAFQITSISTKSYYKLIRYLCLLLYLAAAAAKTLQSCPTLRPHSRQPTRLPSLGFSNAWKWKVKVKSLSCVRLSATPWTAAHQATPSMELFRQEYWTLGTKNFSSVRF